MIPDFISFQPERSALGCHLTGRPPLNFGTEYLALYAALASTAASTAISYDAAQDQKKAVKEQGEANAKAAEMEATRMAAETAENSRRTAVEQRRFRAQQAGQLASTGLRIDTGSPLAIASDTITGQQMALGDIGYGNSVQQRALGWQAEQYRRGAQQQAGIIGKQQTAGLIQGVGNAASTGFSIYGNTAQSSYGSVQRSQQPYSIAGSGYKAPQSNYYSSLTTR